MLLNPSSVNLFKVSNISINVNAPAITAPCKDVKAKRLKNKLYKYIFSCLSFQIIAIIARIGNNKE